MAQSFAHIGRIGVVGLRKAFLIPLQVLGFFVGFSLRFYVLLMIGAGLLWFGFDQRARWQGVPGGSQPGTYTAPGPQGSGPIVTAPAPPFPPSAAPQKPTPVPSYPQPVVRKIPPHLLPSLPPDIPAPRFATVPDNPADSPQPPRRLNLD